MYFANILLTHEYPLGRQRPTSRKKADWFHSIAVFSENSISELEVGNRISCQIIHFFGSKGSPVLDTFNSTIYCHSIRYGKKIYELSGYGGSYGVIGIIRTIDGQIESDGKTDKSIDEIVKLAYKKWGYNRIPYAHQREESYNCVGFTDDILYFMKYNEWNPRIVQNHKKHGLYI